MSVFQKIQSELNRAMYNENYDATVDISVIVERMEALERNLNNLTNDVDRWDVAHQLAQLWMPKMGTVSPIFFESAAIVSLAIVDAYRENN